MLKRSVWQAKAKEGRQGEGSRLTYLPGLDGLRALAVMAVLFYHAEMTWMQGGFLGVEVFFVISGYLITSLLLVEWGQRGTLDLKGFWVRRARRLLPAVIVLILSVLAFSVLFLPDEVAGLRGDAAAAAGYASNWYLILSHKSYFETVGRPSLLKHLWSLAVEEQFYLVWPPLLLLGLRFFRRRHVLMAILLGAAASTALMAALYQPDVDPSRVYYGTDTRAAGLLIGAALAFVWSPFLPSSPGRGALAWLREAAPAPLLDLAGLGALAAVAGSCVWVNEYQPFLYRGGFALVSLATAVVIAAAVHPRAHLGRSLLGWAPLRWIGLRSYGIYLWHYPIFMLTRPQLDVPLSGLPLLAVRLAATAVVAELSYRFVETPIRRGALGRAWAVWRAARGTHRRSLGFRWALAVVAFVVAGSALGQSVVNAQPPAPPPYLAAQSIDTISTDGTPVAALAAAEPPGSARPAPRMGPTRPEWAPIFTPAAPAPAVSALAAGSAMPPHVAALRQSQPQPTASPSAPAASASTDAATAAVQPAASAEVATAAAGSAASDAVSPAAVPTQATGPVPARAATPNPQPAPSPTAAPHASGTGPGAEKVTAIGDSVMLGAAAALQAAIPGLQIDAAVGRQASTAVSLLAAWQAAGELGPVVVIQMGNNGTFSARQLGAMMAILAGQRRVVLVDVKVPRQWEASNNAMLAAEVGRYPNAVLVDWYGASADHPEYFWGDGIHLRPEGAAVYSALIAGAIGGK